MRNAARLLSLLTILCMCLAMSTGAYASAGTAVPAGDRGPALGRLASAPEAAGEPSPDPAPPEPAEPDGIDPADDGSEEFIVAAGQNAALQDTELSVLGGDPLADDGEGYVNTPDDARMTAPPWGLGINGGRRAIRLTGLAPGLSLVRTQVTAAGWGALSADGAQDAAVTAVDSDLRILSAKDGGMDSGWELLGYDQDDYGSGYGACLTDGASAYWYGSTVAGATYGALLDGADQVWFGSSTGTVLLYDGVDLTGSVRGQGRSTSIDSVFGLMMDADAACVTVEDGTRLHAADAVVLYKDGSGAFSFNNARLSSDKGVLLQMMDNDDDDRIGLLTGSYGFSPVYDERNVGGGPGFPTAHADPQAEEAPAPSEDPDSLPPTPEPQQVSVSFANGLYAGNIYNGTGYYGQPGDALSVTVGKGALLDGDICLTSTAKAIPYSPEAVELLDGMDGVEYCLLSRDGAPCQEDQAAYIQFLRYSIGQYYLQGHVENLPCYNGRAAIQVTVAEGGAWAVKDTSILTGLTVEDGALVYGQILDNGDGSLTLLPSGQTLEPGEYASNVAAFASDGAGGPDTEPAQEAPRQIVVTIGGRQYALDVYTVDGRDYVPASELLRLYFGDIRGPSI